jgi:predicted porin
MKHLAAFCVLAAVASGACAQSNVTIYGSLDEAAVRISNLGGSHLYRLDPGTTQPDRIGFRGSEDLGGGLRAHFQLESGFGFDTGTNVSPAFFNRISVVGLSGSFGALQAGHQPDLMYDFVGRTSNGFQLGNFYAFHPGNFDTLANTFQFDNAVRYDTPSWDGLVLAAIAAAGEGAGRNSSVGANYVKGPLRVAAAYSIEDKRTLRGFAPFAAAAGLPASGAMDRVKNAGIGAAWRGESLTLNAALTQTEMRAAGRDARMRNLDLGGTYFIAASDSVNLGYSHSTLGDVHWNTYSLMNLYYLSKRTQIYAQGTLQRASSGQAAVLNGVGASSDNRQNVVGVGVHHSF